MEHVSSARVRSQYCAAGLLSKRGELEANTVAASRVVSSLVFGDQGPQRDPERQRTGYRV